MREISPGIFVETDQRGANYAGIVTDDGIDRHRHADGAQPGQGVPG